MGWPKDDYYNKCLIKGVVEKANMFGEYNAYR